MLMNGVPLGAVAEAQAWLPQCERSFAAVLSLTRPRPRARRNESAN
jgi:hypothetical protein